MLWGISIHNLSIYLSILSYLILSYLILSYLILSYLIYLIYLSIYLIYLSNLSIYPSIDRSIYLSIYLSVYLSIYLSIYLYIYCTIQPDFSAAISSGDAKQHPLGRVDSHKGPHGEAAIRATRKQGAVAFVALVELQENNLGMVLKQWKKVI